MCLYLWILSQINVWGMEIHEENWKKKCNRRKTIKKNNFTPLPVISIHNYFVPIQYCMPSSVKIILPKEVFLMCKQIEREREVKGLRKAKRKKLYFLIWKIHLYFVLRYLQIILNFLNS